MKLHLVLISVLGTSLACAGFPGEGLVDAQAQSPESNGQPQLAYLVEDSGGCALSLRTPGGAPAAFAVWPGKCDTNWALSTKTHGPETQAIITLGDGAVIVQNGKSRKLPDIPRGTIEIVAFGADGDIEAISQEEGTADPEGEGAYTLTPCVRWKLQGESWTETVAETVTMGDGIGDCNFNIGPPLRAVRPNAPGPRGQVGYRRTSAPPAGQSLPPDPKDGEYSDWHYDADLKLLVRMTEGLETMIQQTPVMRWDGERWTALPGLRHPGESIDLHKRGALLLACHADQVHVFDLESGEGRWSTSGFCPIWWPPQMD